MRSIASSGGQIIFDVGGLELEWVWVDGHEIAKVESIWVWLLDRNRETNALLNFRHYFRSLNKK